MLRVAWWIICRRHRPDRAAIGKVRRHDREVLSGGIDIFQTKGAESARPA
jgi:hypothetical protein